jgi:DNA-binding NarL/FixJ family response regulator
MKTIAIIDDKDQPRKAFAKQIKNALEKFYPDWKVIERRPFMNPGEYPQWITENEISVLILDEQLDGEAVEDGKNANYSGHDLAIQLQDKFNSFPVYSITNYASTADLKKALMYFHLILSHEEFEEDVEKYINLFVRSGSNFYKAYQEQLERLGELAEKIANGDAKEKDLMEAKGLQTKLQIPNTTDEIFNRELYLTKLEENLNEIKKTNSEIAKLLNSKK